MASRPEILKRLRKQNPGNRKGGWRFSLAQGVAVGARCVPAESGKVKPKPENWK